LGFHRYAVNTHPDEFIPEPPPSKKILDPPAGHRHSPQSSRSFFSAMVGKLSLADMFCVVLLAKQQYRKLITCFRLTFNVCFIY